MVEGPTPASRREEMLDRLGGPPGRYAVLCVVLAVLWLPFRLLSDRGDPIALIIVASGLRGALWALMPLAIEWSRRARRDADRADDPPSTTPAERRAYARRGALVGLGVGVPFFGALIVLCLVTGRSWAYTGSFAVILLAVVAVAIRGLRHGRV